MRVCFVSRRYFPAVSGMSVYAHNLNHELVAAGHDVTMISQYRDDAFGRGVYGGGPPPAVPGVRVIGLEARGEAAAGDFERDIDEIVAVITAEHAKAPFDVLHAQYGYPTGWAVLLASRALGVPNMVSIQGGDGHWVGSCCETHRLAMVRVLDHAGAAVIGCRSFAQEVTERLGTDPSRLTIVPGAVDTSRFTPPRVAPDNGDAPVLLYHGRVDRRKGVLDTIAALRILRDEGLRFRFILSGIGPDVEPAAALLRETGLDACTTMTGAAAYDDAPAVYHPADIFLSPTYAEGFSNTILEAMASGVAIVSCHAVGVSDCLRDGENGLMVDPGDVPAIANATRRLITDRPLRARLAQAALAECRAVYAWPKVAARLIEIYHAIRDRPVDRDFPTELPRDACRFRAAPHLL